MYILDTNTLIYYFKGQGQVAQNLANVSPQEIGISTIVLLVTHNVKEFSRVSGMAIAYWY